MHRYSFICSRATKSYLVLKIIDYEKNNMCTFCIVLDGYLSMSLTCEITSTESKMDSRKRELNCKNFIITNNSSRLYCGCLKESALFIDPIVLYYKLVM